MDACHFSDVCWPSKLLSLQRRHAVGLRGGMTPLHGVTHSRYLRALYFGSRNSPRRIWLPRKPSFIGSPTPDKSNPTPYRFWEPMLCVWLQVLQEALSSEDDAHHVPTVWAACTVTVTVQAEQ